MRLDPRRLVFIDETLPRPTRVRRYGPGAARTAVGLQGTDWRGDEPDLHDRIFADRTAWQAHQCEPDVAVVSARHRQSTRLYCLVQAAKAKAREYRLSRNLKAFTCWRASWTCSCPRYGDVD